MCQVNNRSKKFGHRLPPPRTTGLGIFQTLLAVNQTPLVTESSPHSSPKVLLTHLVVETIHLAAESCPAVLESTSVEEIHSLTASLVDLHNPFSVLEKATLIYYFSFPDPTDIIPLKPISPPLVISASTDIFKNITVDLYIQTMPSSPTP
ncbi:hypothetical protein MRB53_034848 [Persea americana]|uniref:Uncharacterized protein n=1 Tax=Persea americana TaxID=3435 RepID=A0ACC2K2Y5_PERAE|nr:hypothetical protein MRB53_034848 [Persea americana]